MVCDVIVAVVNGYKPKPILLLILVLVTSVLVIVNTQYLRCARHCSKCVEYMNSLSPHNHTIGWVLYYFPFIDDETEACRGPRASSHKSYSWGWNLSASRLTEGNKHLLGRQYWSPGITQKQGTLNSGSRVNM